MPWRQKAEAESLLERLAVLVATHGSERLLAAPICQPTPRHFPNKWEPTLLGVGRLIDRLFQLAGLDRTSWLLEDERLAFDDELPDSTAEPAINFIGQHEHEGILVFELGAIGPADRLVGALCFEIARAYLEAQRKVDPYRGAPGDALDPHSQEAQVRAAVATIYLGFGPLAIEASHSYRASGEIVGNMAVSRWSHAFAGALPTADLTFLFAVQLVLRDEDDRVIAELLDSLSGEQAKDVHRWVDALRPARDGLAARLRLPLPLELPKPLPLPKPAALDPELEAALRQGEEIYRKPLADLTVHRSYERKTLSYGIIGAIVGIPVGLPLGLWALNNAAIALLPMAVLGLGGALYGRRRRHYSCSACAMILRPSEQSCPKCGARLEGEKLLATRPHQLEDDEEENEELARQALSSRGGDKRGLLDDDD